MSSRSGCTRASSTRPAAASCSARPPIGYVRLASGEWAIDPDEQVQAIVRLIFDQFDREATLHGLLRYLVHHRIRIPVRPTGGPNRGQLEWRRPNRATLQNLLHHPSYAGAYRFGHRPIDPRRKQPGRPTTGKLIRRPEECLVLIRDRLPAYITWDRFEANQERLDGQPGAARPPGRAAAGAVAAGRAAALRPVRPADDACATRGPKNRHGYTCTRGAADYGEPLCQSLSGPVLDELVAGQILAAVEPAALEASLAAVAEVERERAELARHWQLRRERAGYEVDRAARQYQACEPENRLVGPRAGAALGGGAEAAAAAGGRVRAVGSGRPPAGSRATTSGRSGRWPPTCRRCGGRPRPRRPSGSGSPGC